MPPTARSRRRPRSPCGSDPTSWWPGRGTSIAGCSRGSSPRPKASLDPQDDAPGAPDIFQPIVVAQVLREQVKDHVAEVEQDPAALGFAFSAAGDDPPAALHPAQDFLRQRAPRPLAGAGAQE